MKEFYVSIVIESTPGRVWGILTDGVRWPEWAPEVARIKGKIAPSENIVLQLKDPKVRPLALKVTQFVENERMVWTAAMPLGLFKGERTFILTKMPKGGVEFTMRETFTGHLAGMITKSIPDLQPQFDSFASGLKRRAEAAV